MSDIYHKDKKHLIDALTGLYNRQGFYLKTEQLLNQYPQIQFCLIYLNVRKFKVINNIVGRQTGDKVLIQLAHTIIDSFSHEIATFGRLERDNFVICLSKEAVDKGKWMQIGDIHFEYDDSQYHFFSCYGLYQINDKTLSIGSMVDKARVAMETVKNNYLTPYAWYDEKMWNPLVEEEKIVSHFSTALQEKQFKVYYQPVCDTNEGHIIGAEALVRWEQPGEGIISPGRFIPIFEKNGYITVLDRYVWEEVCRMIKERMDQGLTIVPISVNVSQYEFMNESLSEDIKNIVNKYDIPTDYLKIEITESAYSQNPEQVKRAVKKLHEYGFIVLMDDFGSGYSSLNTLKDLPIDVLKIDMDFLENFEENKKAPIIIEAVIRMAKWMKLRVVAEGVETQKEWDYLRSVDCDIVQGYYFYKPMPKDDFLNIIDQISNQGEMIKKSPVHDLDDLMTSVFRQGDNRESILFYSMLGGMGVLEMKGDSIEIIQVNNGFYEELYGDSYDILKKSKNPQKKLDKETSSILLEICQKSMETDSVQQAQIHYLRNDHVYVWLNIKVRYLENQGQRTLFYCAINNIDEYKKAQEDQCLNTLGQTLVKIFDKVYFLNYETGMAEVIYTCGYDDMKAHQTFDFFGFFDKYKDHIVASSSIDQYNAILKYKNLLDEKMKNNHSFQINYEFHTDDSIIYDVNAYLLKLKIKDQERYICCLKKRKKEL